MPVESQPPAPQGVERPDEPGLWVRDEKFWAIPSWGKAAGPTGGYSLNQYGIAGHLLEHLPSGGWRKAVPEGEGEPCSLVHVACGACGCAISAVDGTCNCADNKAASLATHKRDLQTKYLLEIARLRKCDTADIPDIEELESELSRLRAAPSEGSGELERLRGELAAANAKFTSLPTRYGRDHSAHMTIGELVAKLSAAATTDEFCDMIDAEFLFGAHGTWFSSCPPHWLLKDIRGLVWAALRLNESKLAAQECELAELRGRLEHLTELINCPHNDDWFYGVRIEAAHQQERWGAEHDDGKEPQDWFWLIGYLGGKALRAAIDGNPDKAKHHTISTAAVLLNWHRRISGQPGDMRPGIKSPNQRVDELNEVADRLEAALQPQERADEEA